MINHVAGALHSGAGPAWLPVPDDVNALVPGIWSANVARRSDGVLTVAGMPVTELATRFGTPSYLLDEDDFRARARGFKSAFDDAFAGLCGGVDVYYAGKAFLSTQVARWVADEGLRLDTCSGGELAVAQRAGIPGELIGLHGNNKSTAEIRQAIEYGVGRIIVDSLDEIERISKVAVELGTVAPVLLRVTVGVEAHTHDYIATAHEDQKFGLSLTSGQAAEAARRVLDQPSLRLLGLHSHIGSQIFDMSGFEVAASRILGLRADLQAEFGVERAPLEELDLGGGFGISYTSQDDPQSPEDMATTLASVIARVCESLNMVPPRISIEPGRAIAGPSMFTLYRVGTIKDVETGHGYRRYVSVDGGMSDNVRAALYSADYSCTVASRAPAGHPVLSRVVGKHCESGDIVVRDEYLPSDLAEGDLVAVPGTGAYCRSLASNYNHVPRPGVVAVRDGAARLIMRRETIDDLLAFDLDDDGGQAG
ncbi:diaminopimelate decarboxylase [Saxibacter everestensis]|uniref:Diaminopimelate decarboxylase n=1 Tax=Saxibacter everestensis TaxID=2909229 RepID=A0ABY8QQ42_9MICO|nr:diaminopimelate decarboxylase [Brevibacteriaceae bacterium ZFBP1038]